MHGRKGSAVRRRRPIVVVLMLALLVAALALVSTGLGSTGKTHAAAATPVTIGKGGGFGEVYEAKASTLKKTLFKATLLPKNPTARNIALAGLGRADRKVNYDLALKCWKNNGCSTGTGGKLTVAYIEQFGENVYRQMSKMEFILQALTYPQVGKIIYKSAHSDLNQGDRRLQGGDRAEGQPDRHLSGLRRRHAAGHEGGDRRRNPRGDLRLGLRDRARHELPDRRRRGHLRARQGRTRT